MCVCVFVYICMWVCGTYKGSPQYICVNACVKITHASECANVSGYVFFLFFFNVCMRIITEENPGRLNVHVETSKTHFFQTCLMEITFKC